MNYRNYHHQQQSRRRSACKTCQICIETEHSITTQMNSYRPRGSLARMLYDRQIADSYLNKIDKNEWYQCNLDQLPAEVAEKFVQLSLDEDTEIFLKQSTEKSEWIFMQLWHSVLKMVLSLFMSRTSINGWLQRGSMFVLSHSQFLKLSRKSEYWHSESLLDLGAGDGEVTKHIAGLFDRIYVTEVSKTMQNLLVKKGYTLLPLDDWFKEKEYDFISALNLLDRCDKPLELLNYIKSSLKPDGRFLLALVLPFAPFVEAGSPDHKPAEVLNIQGKTFEEQVASLIKDILEPAGFSVVSWTRVPYLCEGDLAQSFYWLNDVVFVLKSM